MGKLDNLKSGQARGGFRPKKVDIGAPSDTPMAADENTEEHVLNVEPTISSSDTIEKQISEETEITISTPVAKVTPPVVVDVVKPDVSSVKNSKYDKTPDTKTKRVNLGLQPDIINYIKFKALRTGIPQYQLVTQIVGTALIYAKENGYKYNTPVLEPYKIKQVSPSHLGIEIPEILFNDVKEYARELLMTQTQFYSYALTEAKLADVNFEY